MKRLHIDFAPSGWRRGLYRTHPVARVLTVIALLLCVFAGYRAYRLLAHLDPLQIEAARLASRADRSARAAHASGNAPIDAKQAAAVNAAVARLNLPWGSLLDAVEAATPASVALLSIAPEPARALLKIEAECASSKDMIDYLKQLEQQALFERVTLVRHERMRDGTDGVIRFQIEAQWRRVES
ncbi:PilN domain-containing protein [Burkholderia sp. Ac-20365]|jgi:Tfp pilus assembly protein PilN|uniref:PilN domain-containing protein n=1 Tax=Burkholderia sp. Ac-20365 TaxID=2703897 RepID=UPI00197B40AA|nr:PilN domain-containing protein [Burkholderia sp. Ac-20365]MBN3766587.1 PilN domain-containing protein [Burkholderia sp. Ac-20365]